MENASKALIMAAEVLIGVMILSLGVYLFTTFGQTARETQQRNEEQQIMQFNTRFTVYLDRRDLTIYDISTIVNYVKENNQMYDNDVTHPEYIRVDISGSGISGGGVAEGGGYERINGFLEDRMQNDLSAITPSNPQLPTYTCYAVEDTNNNGKVDTIKFRKN